MRKILSVILALSMILCLAACGSTEKEASVSSVDAEDGNTFYKIGICNYVDDASLNQIVENIESQIEALSLELGFDYTIDYDNCNADASVLNQIISNFINDKVDVMIAIATPVAMAMQAATEDNQIPVVFAAVSDPVSCGLVESMEAPGENLTGTSDYLNTDAILNLILALNPNPGKIAFLYDLGQDSSTASIAAAEKKLDSLGISHKAFNPGNTAEAGLAAQSIIDEGFKIVFTPTDNTIMTAELSIYEMFIDAGVQHFAGADSFALNGAFMGYGVDYINLGRETADMVIEILNNNAEPALMPVKTFDNGIAVVNSEVCKALELDFNQISESIAAYCTEVKSIDTSANF